MHRSYREADRVEGSGVAGLARVNGLSRVWRVVPGEAGWAVCGGEESQGNITWPGYEHLRVGGGGEDDRAGDGCFRLRGIRMPVDPKVDYSKETPTLVEFRLQPTAGGTRC